MASGDVVGAILQSVPPDSSRAELGNRQSATTIAENFPIVAFDDTATEYWDFLIAIEGYGTGGLTVEIPWTTASGTTSNVTWGIAFRRLDDDAADSDLDATFTYAFNTVSAAAPTAAGRVQYDSVTFTNGTDMDSMVDGDRAWMRVRRSDANGDGDAQILWPAIIIRET